MKFKSEVFLSWEKFSPVTRGKYFKLFFLSSHYIFLQGSHKEGPAWGALCWQSRAWGQETGGGGVAGPDGGVAGQDAACCPWPAWESGQGK